MERLATLVLGLLGVVFLSALARGQGLRWLQAKFLGKGGDVPTKTGLVGPAGPAQSGG
jgi:hypothetical protein